MKPRRRGHAGLREQEEHEQAAEHRTPEREAAVVVEGVVVVTSTARDGEDREGADRHERVHEQERVMARKGINELVGLQKAAIA